MPPPRCGSPRASRRLRTAHAGRNRRSSWQPAKADARQHRRSSSRTSSDGTPGRQHPLRFLGKNALEGKRLHPRSACRTATIPGERAADARGDQQGAGRGAQRQPDLHRVGAARRTRHRSKCFFKDQWVAGFVLILRPLQTASFPDATPVAGHHRQHRIIGVDVKAHDPRRRVPSPALLGGEGSVGRRIAARRSGGSSALEDLAPVEVEIGRGGPEALVGRRP